MNKFQTKSMQIKAEAVQDDGFFSGYCSVFDVEDSYGDVVKKGAFLNSLNKWQNKGKMPPVLWQHSRGEVIGIWTKLVEDEKGLYGEGRLLIDDVAKAKEVHALIKAGAVDGLSIGFYTKKWAYDQEKDIMELLEIDLKEISIVTFPANEESTVAQVKAERQKDLDEQNAIKILQSIQF